MSSILWIPEDWKEFFDKLMPEKNQTPGFLPILYSKPLREQKKPKFEIGDRLRFTKFDLLSGSVRNPSFTKFF